MSDAIFTKKDQEAPAGGTQFSGGPTASRPSNAAKWLHYFDTDLLFGVVWDGSQWRPGFRGPIGPQGATGPTGASAF